MPDYVMYSTSEADLKAELTAMLPEWIDADGNIDGTNTPIIRKNGKIMAVVRVSDVALMEWFNAMQILGEVVDGEFIPANETASRC